MERIQTARHTRTLPFFVVAGGALRAGPEGRPGEGDDFGSRAIRAVSS